MKHLFILLSLAVISFMSCKSGSANSEKNTDGKALASEETLVLRTDSVLQFSVMVTSIFEDSKGRFWFGSHGDGLCMFDGEIYTYFTAGNGLPVGEYREFAPGLDWDDRRVINSGNQAGGVQEDMDGNMWCESAGKICKYNGKEFVPVSLSNELKLPKGEEWDKCLDYLWFGWPNGLGAVVYNGKTLEYLKFPVDDPRGWDRISAKCQDSKGTLWFGTMDHGTFKYDGSSFESVLSETETGISRSIFEDASSRIWFPQNGKDMHYSEDGKMHNFSEEYKVQFPETKEEDLLTGAQTMEQDANGDIWCGTFGDGLYRYNGTTVTRIMPNGDESLSLCKSIYKDRSGNLVFGLGEGSVYVLRGDSFVRFDKR